MTHLFDKTRTFTSILVCGLLIFLSLLNIPVNADSTSLRDLHQVSGYAKQPIVELANRKIILGDANRNFYPQKVITRAEMITLLVRILGLNTNAPSGKATFKDVPVTHWVYPYVQAAYQQGITNGISKDIFGVNEPCTREEMTAMFVRALGVSPSSSAGILNQFSDRNSISSWAKAYVEYASANNLVKGTGNGSFQPKAPAVKEQAAVIAHRVLTNQSTGSVTTENTGELTLKEIIASEAGVVVIETFDKDGNLLAQGSGFSIHPGLFLTNYHVVQGGSKYTLTTHEGSKAEADGIVKYDEDTDIAVIKVEKLSHIAPLKTGSLQSVSKGDRIVTIGSPQGLQNSISEGIVSGIRKFEYGQNDSVDMIQITAPISPGNSGGALMNFSGEVVGVTTAVSKDGNIGFAVAIDEMKAWMPGFSSSSLKSIPVLDMTKASTAYLNMSDKDIKDLIYKAFRALEEEDLHAYLSTVHKFNPVYKTTEEFFKPLFENYDLEYDLLEVSVGEKSYDSAVVDVLYTLKEANALESTQIKVSGFYSLSKYQGEWKIYFAQETILNHPTGDAGSPGSGGIIDSDGHVIIQDPVIEDVDEPMRGTQLNFQVKDSIQHPTKPILYFSDMNGKKLYAYDYVTRTTSEASFTLTPESIAFANNEIYIALLKGNHSPYWFEETQKGAIAVLDSDTLKLKEQFDINIDPYDIVVGRDGYIYVPSGSGQWTNIKSYSRESRQEVASSFIRNASLAELHPTVDKIYTITTDSSPRDISAYNITDGKFASEGWSGGVDSPYHGDYPMSINFKISPDGKYIFNGAGTVFSCVLSQGGVMTYHGKLNKGFTDIAFDLYNNRFFTAVGNGFIYEYEYSTLKGTNTYKVKGEIVYLYYTRGNLSAVTKIEDKYYLEAVVLEQ